MRPAPQRLMQGPPQRWGGPFVCREIRALQNPAACVRISSNSGLNSCFACWMRGDAVAFDTSVLDRALAQRRAARERERQAVLDHLLQLLDELGPRYGISEAYVFGSVTRPGRFDERSDVDIAVEEMAPEDFFDAISAFSTALGREVDLVELRKCRFADRIRSQGIRWKKAN